MLLAYPLFSHIPHIATGLMLVLQSAVKWRIEIVGLAVEVVARPDNDAGASSE
jgi:hypothetical protein